MTTIALKGGVLAIDSQVTVGNVITFKPKLYVCEGLGAVAVCGDMDNAENVARWFFRGCSGVKPGLDWAAYYMTQDNGTFYANGDSTITNAEPTAHDGSGGVVAFTAMHLGKDAYTAVRTAIELDPYTGGNVCWYQAGTGKYMNAIIIRSNDLEPIETKLPKHISKQEN